jgi:diacylglycerol kinase family enzyme
MRIRVHHPSLAGFQRAYGLGTCKQAARSGPGFELHTSVNVWILCNENAGRGLPAEDIVRLVEQAGHTVVGVAKQYDGRTPPPSRHLDLMVAAGGDGTVATVASLAFASSLPLAVLPLGTANNIATSLGLTSAIPQLIEGWASARRVRFDLAHVRSASKEWRAIESVGGGLVAEGIARAESAHEMSGHVDPALEVAASVRIFRDALDHLEPRSWTLTIDGVQTSEALLLVEVLNIRSIGPNLVFGPSADPSDGYFDVVMAHERHREELMTYLDCRAEGRDTRLALPTRRARHVMIDTCGELHIDARRINMRELGRIEIGIEPKAITVLL